LEVASDVSITILSFLLSQNVCEGSRLTQQAGSSGSSGSSKSSAQHPSPHSDSTGSQQLSLHCAASSLQQSCSQPLSVLVSASAVHLSLVVLNALHESSTLTPDQGFSSFEEEHLPSPVPSSLDRSGLQDDRPSMVGSVIMGSVVVHDFGEVQQPLDLRLLTAI
jgi:hypothetical protein